MTRCGSWVILYAKRDNWLTVDPYALECKPRGSEPGGLLLLFIVIAMMKIRQILQDIFYDRQTPAGSHQRGHFAFWSNAQEFSRQARKNDSGGA